MILTVINVFCGFLSQKGLVGYLILYHSRIGISSYMYNIYIYSVCICIYIYYIYIYTSSVFVQYHVKTCFIVYLCFSKSTPSPLASSGMASATCGSSAEVRILQLTMMKFAKVMRVYLYMYRYIYITISISVLQARK